MNLNHKISLATIIVIFTSVSILVYVDSAFASEPILGPPLKQVEAGVSILKVKCNPDFIKEYKRNLMPICITEESQGPLMKRGFIKMRIVQVGDELNQENLCKNWPDMQLVQRHC